MITNSFEFRDDIRFWIKKLNIEIPFKNLIAFKL